MNSWLYSRLTEYEKPEKDHARGDKPIEDLIEESLTELKKVDPDMTVFADEQKENEVLLRINFRIQGRN